MQCTVEWFTWRRTLYLIKHSLLASLLYPYIGCADLAQPDVPCKFFQFIWMCSILSYSLQVLKLREFQSSLAAAMLPAFDAVYSLTPAFAVMGIILLMFLHIAFMIRGGEVEDMQLFLEVFSNLLTSEPPAVENLTHNVLLYTVTMGLAMFLSSIYALNLIIAQICTAYSESAGSGIVHQRIYQEHAILCLDFLLKGKLLFWLHWHLQVARLVSWSIICIGALGIIGMEVAVVYDCFPYGFNALIAGHLLCFCIMHFGKYQTKDAPWVTGFDPNDEKGTYLWLAERTDSVRAHPE